MLLPGGRPVVLLLRPRRFEFGGGSIGGSSGLSSRDALEGEVAAGAATTNVRLDSQKQKVLDIILEYAITGDGEIGDGKIFITKIDEVIRVRTNETGEEAL